MIISTSIRRSQPLLSLFKEHLVLLVTVLFFSFYGMVTAAQANAAGQQPVTSAADNSAPHAVRNERPLPSDILTYGIELAALERSYDATLYQVLAYFFKPGTFLSDVRMEVTVRTNDSDAAHKAGRSPAAMTMPQVSTLPGMPNFNGETTLPRLAAAERTLEFSALELKRLHITLYVDAVYTASMQEFMKQLIIAAVKVEPQRGDRVQIIALPFPRKTHDQLVAVTESDTISVMDVTPPPEEAIKDHGLHKLFELQGMVLAISSVLLIFFIIYLTVTLRRRYV